MPRRKVNTEERYNDPMENLVNDHNKSKEEVKVAAKEGTSAPGKRVKATKQELAHKRTKLLRLLEDGEIDKSVKYLKKASSKFSNKIFAE